MIRSLFIYLFIYVYVQSVGEDRGEDERRGARQHRPEEGHWRLGQVCGQRAQSTGMLQAAQ